jgi:hypothetical protein
MTQNDWIEVLKFLIPQLAILGMIYLFLTKWLQRERQISFQNRKEQFNKHILPNKLHALERMVLYLERISPNNLIPRMNQPGLSAKEFQFVLSKEIADEYEHNLSQQLYMSENTWSLITLAKDKMIQDILAASQSLPEGAPSKDLAYKIIENSMSAGRDLCSQGIKALKSDLNQTIN